MGRQLFHEARARVGVQQSRRVIELFKGRDLSTPLCQPGRVWAAEAFAAAGQIEAVRGRRDEIAEAKSRKTVDQDPRAWTPVGR